MPSVAKHSTEYYARGIPIPFGSSRNFKCQEIILNSVWNFKRKEIFRADWAYIQKIIYTSLFRVSMVGYISCLDDEFTYSPYNVLERITRHMSIQNSFPSLYIYVWAMSKLFRWHSDIFKLRFYPFLISSLHDSCAVPIQFYSPFVEQIKNFPNSKALH
jgi:hypothetical protein